MQRPCSENIPNCLTLLEVRHKQKGIDLMKRASFTLKLRGQLTAQSPSTSEWQVICQRVLVRDGLHCRICGTSGKLLCHCRTDEHQSSELHDVIALCEPCYELAQLCKQKRMQSKMTSFLHLICIIALFGGAMVLIMLLTRSFSLSLTLLYIASVYAVLLLEKLSNRWL